jgi:hypothetical protein
VRQGALPIVALAARWIGFFAPMRNHQPEKKAGP